MIELTQHHPKDAVGEGGDSGERLAGGAEHTVQLPFVDRQKARLRVQTVSGTELAIKLPRGTVLRGGDVLSDGAEFRVLIAASPERVSCVQCSDARLLARAAYHLGNRHVWVQVEDNSLCYLHDHVLDDMLRGLGVEVTVIDAPFEPEAGAYAGGHHHDHHHGSDDQHGATSSAARIHTHESLARTDSPGGR